MENYSLQTIPGTENIVEKELILKFPNVIVEKKAKSVIEFKSGEENINTFRIIKSALRISSLNPSFGQKTINLFRRDWKKESSPAGTNPALAYIMCSLASLNSSDTFLDPFCGSGTIPITACVEFMIKKALGSDSSTKAIEKAIINSQTAVEQSLLTKSKITFFRSGVQDLRLKKNSINKIVTNMPFGIRSSEHDKNILTYTNFYKLCSTVLRPEGIVVALTLEKKLLADRFSNHQFELLNKIDIDQSGLFSSIYVYKKRRLNINVV